jgi:acyl carrier protein
MTPQDIRAGVISTLCEIAPEVVEAELVADQSLRNQVDLDSMDWLNVIIGLHQRFDVQIPEADYGRLDTLDHITAYLADKRVR